MARQRESIYEVRQRSRHSVEVQEGYEIVMATLDELVAQGLVVIDNERLSLGSLTRQPWLEQAILDGESAAWQIVDYFPDKEKKFNPDQEAQLELGQIGETFVVNTLLESVPRDLTHLIDQVSLRDDSAGFDIQCPMTSAGEFAHLEVKTSSRPSGGLRFYLSSNEWRQAKKLRNWFLVFVRVLNGQPELFGHLPAQSLTEYLPVSKHRDFEWDVVRGRFDADDVFPRLPIRF